MTIFGGSATLAGAGGLSASSPGPQRYGVATFNGVGTFFNGTRQIFRPTITIPASSSLTVAPRQRMAASARFAGSGYWGKQWPASARLTGEGNIPWLFVYFGPVPIGPIWYVKHTFAGEGTLYLDAEWVGNDKVWPGVLPDAGSQVLYQNATGFEKALADVDAWRLTRTYAELIKDQWDPYAISSRNLPYLAWAVGVNLWENWWSEEFKRYWVDIQWTAKYERGSLKGLDRFISAVGGKLKRCIVPPAKTFPLGQVSDVLRDLESLVPGAQYTAPRSVENTRAWYESLTWTDSRPQPSWADLVSADRAAYVARFPQLRLYPYVARVNLKYICWVGHLHHPDGSQAFGRNGSFLGPLWKMYPTNQDAGGRYTRTATIYEPRTLKETTLTVRRIARILTGENAGWGFTPGVSQYDEQVILPLQHRPNYFIREKGKGLGIAWPHGIFLGHELPLRTITISRSGPLPLTQGKAQYQTILPSNDLLDLLPEKVSEKHAYYKTSVFEGVPPPQNRDRKQYLLFKYLPRSKAWRYLYDRWYLFDPDRVPDNRVSGVFMGHTRFGIHKYTAEALIRVRTQHKRFFLQTHGFLRGYFRPKDTETIARIRRGVTASMAERDTVLINTNVTRVIQVRDPIDCSGRTAVGQLVEN